MTGLSGAWLEVVRAAITLGMALGAAWVVHLVMRALVKWSRRTPSEVDTIVLEACRGKAWIAVLVIGGYVSTLHFTALGPYRETLRSGLVALLTLLLALVVIHLINGSFKHFEVRLQAERADLGLLRRLLNVTVILVGAMVVLQYLGINITPVLASLGVAGLAVALALQDTLSNFFAGVHLALDRPIRVGDFIRLESGEEGFVEEIGWRSTRLRPWANNIIVIPNAVLAQTRITNYYLPEQRMSVYVACGVSYESDLQRVEAVTVEVAREVMARTPGSDPDWTPVVRWKEFADSNINFVTVLRVVEFAAQYALASELIKALHERFNAEGIEISWPMRKLVTPGLPVAVTAVPPLAVPPANSPPGPDRPS